jgi:ubiquinone/menaquinone biosynthesis C-methylase UbiE
MTFSENLCLFLNHFFPKLKRAGRGSAIDYSEAQYGWAKIGFDNYGSLVDLKDKEVLDAGCSLGGKTIFYSEQGCKSIIGLDIDEKRIGLAKEFAAKKNSTNTRFMVGSIAEMPFEDNTFDYIFMNDVVEHIARPILIDALKECKRVIKPGGKICLEFPPWTSFDASHLYDYIYTPWCQLFFSSKTLINVVNKLAPEQTTLGKLSIVEHFEELNRITIKEFKQMVNDIGFKVVLMKPNVIFGIAFFGYIPFFNKYLTKRYMAILSK